MFTGTFTTSMFKRQEATGTALSRVITAMQSSLTSRRCVVDWICNRL